MPTRELRRLLFVQAILLLVGWFATLACHGASSGAMGVAKSAAALTEAVGVVAAFVSFAMAGKIRVQVNRLRRSESPFDDVDERQASAAA